MGKVKILKEKVLPEFLEGARPQSHCKFCSYPPEEDPMVHTAVDRQGNIIASVNMAKNRQVEQC